MTEVYGDLLFLVNAGMDCLCLCLTARLLHRPLALWRLLLSSALGGVYAVLVLLWDVGQPWALLIDLGVCLLMCLVALGKKGKGGILLSGGVYLAASMVLGGVMTGLYHLLNRAGLPALLPDGEESLSSVAFVILAGGGGLVTYGWGRFFRRTQRVRMCTLNVTIDGKKASVSGMVDSGNLLKDPMGGGLVIPVRMEAVAELLSPDMRKLLSAEKRTLAGLENIAEARRLRLIPAGTATGEGLLMAITPDTVTVAPEGKPPHTVKALIAPLPLSGAPADAMVPEELML